jgi:cell division protein FtsQ
LRFPSAAQQETPSAADGVSFSTGKSRNGSLRRRWWRPSSKLGRILLTSAALLLLAGLAASAYLLKICLDRDGRFRISGSGNIEAAGLTEVSRTEMLPVFGEDIGRNIFFVPLSERRKQLEEIPWVESATVMRILPNQIRVTVVERKPVAFARQGGQFGLVDANGVLLTMPAAMMAQHHYSFPVVTGIAASDPQQARKARMAVYQRLLAELDSNGQQLSEQISEIDLSDPQDARVLMPEQGGDILAHFGDDRFLDRYQRYKAHIAEWRQQYPKLAAVDLRNEQQVVLEMAPGTNVAQAAVDEQAANVADAGQEKTPDSSAAEKPPAKSAIKPAPKAKTASDNAKTKAEAHKVKPVKAAAKVKTAAKAGSKKAVKSKAALKTAKAKDAKRAAAKRAALKTNKRKTTSHPGATSRQGQ